MPVRAGIGLDDIAEAGDQAVVPVSCLPRQRQELGAIAIERGADEMLHRDDGAEAERAGQHFGPVAECRLLPRMEDNSGELDAVDADRLVRRIDADEIAMSAERLRDRRWP